MQHLAKYFFFVSFYEVMILHHLNCDSSQHTHTNHHCAAGDMGWLNGSVPGEVSGDW